MRVSDFVERFRAVAPDVVSDAPAAAQGGEDQAFFDGAATKILRLVWMSGSAPTADDLTHLQPCLLTAMGLSDVHAGKLVSALGRPKVRSTIIEIMQKADEGLSTLTDSEPAFKSRPGLRPEPTWSRTKVLQALGYGPNDTPEVMGLAPVDTEAVNNFFHVHHIIPREMQGGVAAQLRALAESHGLDQNWIVHNEANQTVAPLGFGTHSQQGLQEVLTILKRAPDNEAFIEALKGIGRDMANGNFYIRLGRLQKNDDAPTA